ncbi:MAG: glycosyltransferase family 4 protein [Candidatus Paceibacterota bacterium]
MKILIATGIYPPDIGGPATYSQLLREKLPEKGIQVKILTFGEVRYLPKVIRHLVFFCKAMIRGRDVDIIFAQDPVSVGFPSWLTTFIMRKKFFIRVAGDYAWEQAVQRYGIKDNIDDFQKKKYGAKTSFLRMIQRFVVGRADTVFTPSIYFRDLVAGWNKKQKRVFHIYNGIDMLPVTQSKEDARKVLAIPSDTKVLVTIGRLVPWKGFFGLIDVVGDLQKVSSQYRLYIVGTGPDKESLKKYISERGLDEVVFLTGAVPREKVFSYLVASDVFVLNTSFESFSFQIVEAMHAGTPVISTDIGNISEIVENGEEGILVAPDDKKALSDSILKIVNDEQFRSSIIMQAKIKSKMFSIENTLNKLYTFLVE